MNKIIPWAVDIDFMAQAEAMLPLVDVLSLDVFDTALTRTVDSPIDVFAEVEKRLFQHYGVCANGFAEKRELAEQKARRVRSQQGYEDVTLELIYQNLDGSEWMRTRSKELEIQVEKDVSVAVPEILRLSQRAKAVGKKVIFVSDMYLPQGVVYDLLVAAGYNTTIPYVSSHVGETKSKGTIWQTVKSNNPGTILHIGDDEWSDVTNPSLLGIKTMRFERVISNRRCGARLTPNVLPFSYFNRKAELEKRMQSPLTEAEKWNYLGRTFGVNVLPPFLQWLKERAVKNGVKCLYFLARDGYLLHKAWEASGIANDTRIESRYLQVSRRTINPAAGFFESRANYFSPHLTQFLFGVDNATTVRHLLDRVSLSNSSIEYELRKAYGSLDAKIAEHPKGIDDYALVVRRNSHLVFNSLRFQHRQTISYLGQQGVLDDTRMAIVDTGWNGTMQRGLNKLRHSGTEKLMGFYYGLWHYSGINRFDAGYMESAFASPFELPSDNPEIALSVALLEELHSSGAPSVIGYLKNSDRVYVPQYQDAPEEVKQYQDKVQHFQAGAIDAVRTIFEKGQYGPLKINDLTLDTAKAALAQLLLSPNKEELELLGSIGHAFMFDHSTFNPINRDQPNDKDLAGDLIDRNDWKLGLLRHWHAKATNAEERKVVRDLATSKLDVYMSERQLRQFWV